MFVSIIFSVLDWLLKHWYTLGLLATFIYFSKVTPTNYSNTKQDYWILFVIILITSFLWPLIALVKLYPFIRKKLYVTKAHAHPVE